MTKHSDLRWVTARINLACARLQTGDPEARNQAAGDLVEAAFAIWSMSDLDPVRDSIRAVLKEGKP